MNKYRDSFERFTHIDGDNYGPELFGMDCGHFYIEQRVHKASNTVAFIQYWPNGEGYHIYVDESLLQPQNP